MPVNAKNLLTDLKKRVTRFEDDLREQCEEVPELDERLKKQYQEAKDAGRTAFAYSVWRDGELTQSAVGWVLSCVFVRFLEDNHLLQRTFLSGTGEDREVADETRAAYFREQRTDSDNDYLEYVIREVGKLPGMADLMDARHNALWNASISGDAAKAFIEFWRRIDPATGELAHDFADEVWDTRFLGDLYQDLSESARKKYALLQTPDFVEEFILDRTLDPAINTFGLKEVRMIDPTCGSGHFLLGGFGRLLKLWEKDRADLSERELVVKALSGVYGVDINPFAVAIARFRLLFAAWQFCGVKQLKSAPDFKVNLAVGDSLLHGARFSKLGEANVVQHQPTFGGGEKMFQDEIAHFFDVEDSVVLHRILGQQYHAVVGNPPYISVKDSALKALYRARYDSCAGKWVLSIPFMERFFDLALSGSGDGRDPAGFTGQITSNSFMKREFGKKLIGNHIPGWDLTHVLDTSGAYIPGHGTPTVILFGRNAKPATTTVRTVMGIKGEPATPNDPAKGQVWRAIVDQVDRPGSESDFVSAADTEREKFHKHPWSIGGGGATELQVELDESGENPLLKDVTAIGFGAILGEDEAFGRKPGLHSLLHIPVEYRRSLVEGDQVRDWDLDSRTELLFPYTKTIELAPLSHFENFIWPHRALMEGRRDFSKRSYRECGRPFWEYHQIPVDRNQIPLSITFAFVATHNHFVLDRGGKVFKQTAPVIKLPTGSTEDDHLRLLGLLNSATACFWMQQVCQGKHIDEPGFQRFEYDSTKLKRFPVPAGTPLILARKLDRLARELFVILPESLTACDAIGSNALAEAEQAAVALRARMISHQEELDWQCYRLYGLIDSDDDLEWPEVHLDELPPLALGERAFEIRMARQMAAGDLESTWFERHKDAGSKPTTEFPDHWPADYRALIERRLAFIEANKNINLIERPEYKRRWNTEPWAKRQEVALRKWLLTRLECYFHDSDRMIEGEDEAVKTKKLEHLRPIRTRFAGGSEPKLVSVSQLTSAAKSDDQWMEAATVYSGGHDFDPLKLVKKLVLAESVPFLPVQRYKPAGLRKRIEWENTWDLQRQEDEVEAEVRKEHQDKIEEQLKPLILAAQKTQVGDIPVPPKYTTKDFVNDAHWKLRGKLDVPKERWILYPGAEGGHDESLIIAWAGWDHAQQAQALTGYYQQASETWGWDKNRLGPLLAGIKELLPWLKQWHDEIDPKFGERPSAAYQQFYQSSCQSLQLSEEDIEVIRMGGNAS